MERTAETTLQSTPMQGTTRAAAFMVLSALAFAVMGAFVKLVPEVPLWDKVLVRNLVTLIVAAWIVRRRRSMLFGRRENRRLLLLRSLLGIGGVACYFYAIDHLLLADATMLTRLSPFFVAVLARLFLRETLSRATVFAMVVALVGGIAIIKPRFDLSVIPALVGLASAIFAGGAYTAIRSLRDREPPETIVFTFSFWSAVTMLPLVLSGFHVPTASEALWLAAIGLSAAAGQLWLTAAYRHAPAAEVSVYGHSMIVFAALIGLTVWNELPDALSLGGGLLIIAAGALVFLRNRSHD
jgi:drug/metabolite transporter (DMT)-like permease